MHHFKGHSFEAVVAETLSLGREDGDAWVVSFALFMPPKGRLKADTTYVTYHGPLEGRRHVRHVRRVRLQPDRDGDVTYVVSGFSRTLEFLHIESWDREG